VSGNIPGFISNIKSLLKEAGQYVSEVEMISGNYDDDGSLISTKIPSITTDFCEIGTYDEICYFTIILKSDLFSKDLLDSLSAYKNIQIYGLNNFLENYYPKDNFIYKKFEEKIRSEEYTQVQFNFDSKKLTPEKIVQEYTKIKSLFEKLKIAVENQLEVDF